MINIIIPRGSKRRDYVRNTLTRIRHRRKFQYHKKQYNLLRQDYYKTATRLYINDENAPLISIIVPCFNTPNRYIKELVDSVFAQGYDKWELVLVDASDDLSLSGYIKYLSSTDIRVIYKKVSNHGIAVNTNAGIKIANGDYIAFLDHDDTLDPDALAENAAAILNQDADVVYSDEDKLSDDGSMYFDPHFKPDFSIAMLRCVNYITHFVVVKTELVKKVGFIQPGFDGAQDYNFLLNIVDVTEKIVHIPKILYHWRMAVNSTASDFSNKKHITRAGEKALNNHYSRNKIPAIAHAIENRPGFYKTKYTLPSRRRAIVIDLPKMQSKKLEYIINAYKIHKDIKNDNIDIVVSDINDKKIDNYQDVLYVNKPIAPPSDVDDSLNMVFGMLVAGSDFVSIKRVSKNLITDSGLVKSNNTLVPLFFGFDPQSPNYFGSTEWNREVNGLNWGIVAGDLNKIRLQNKTNPITKGILTVLAQCEYVEFKEIENNKISKEGKNYFNTNLYFEMFPRTFGFEKIIDRINLDK